MRESRLNEVTRLQGQRGSERFCHSRAHTYLYLELVDTRGM